MFDGKVYRLAGVHSPTVTCPEVSIIVPSWNTRDLLSECLRSIAQTSTDLDCETLVIDNASTDGSDTLVRERFPQVRVIRNVENAGFARAANRGAAASTGRYLLLLNSDAWLQPGALRALLTLATEQPRCGIVGAQLRNADGSFQASHASFPTLAQEFLMLSGLGRALYGPWYPSHGPDAGRARRVDYVGGACLLARRAAFDDVGGLDEGFFMYAEEIDLCLRLRQAGWEVWYQPAAQVIHVGHASSRHRRTEREGDLYRSRVRFFRKHHGPRAARLLAAQIYAFTAVKRPWHALLYRLSGGRYGRPVISLRRLVLQMRDET